MQSQQYIISMMQVTKYAISLIFKKYCLIV
jgi:hypothetical protein